MSERLDFYDQMIQNMNQIGWENDRLISLFNQLKELVPVWQNMPQGREVERNAKSRFYDNKIFPIILEVFQADPKNRSEKKYDCLFSTLGESPHPVVLTILALGKPEKIVLFHTAQTERYVDFVAERAGISSQRQCEPVLIDGSDVAQLYKQMKDRYTKYMDQGNVAIDITGGKKTMSCGAAMAGFIINADMFYIDNHGYDSAFRRPMPGAEFLYQVKNPLEIFGEIEMKAVVELFNNYNYARAAGILKTLENRVPDERPVILVRLLNDAYRAWDDLQIDEAKARMNELIEKIKRYGKYGAKFEMQNLMSKLEKQNNILKFLSDIFQSIRDQNRAYSKLSLEILSDIEKVKMLLCYLYTNAKRRKIQGKYDTASLIVYRILELIMQRRLTSHGINPDEPDYETAFKEHSKDYNTVLRDFNNEKGKLHDSQQQNLPTKIALLDGYVLLKSLGDGVSIELGHLKRNIEERNKSLLAHGFKPITEKNLSDFQRLADELIKNFCEIEGVDWAAESSAFEFCCLPESHTLWSFIGQ